MTRDIKRTVLIFEGFSSSGKSATINALIENKKFLENYTWINFSRDNPFDLNLLYGDFGKIKLKNKDWIHTAFRISRLGIFINTFIKKENIQIGIFDRGLLTAYLEGVSQNIPSEQILPYIEALYVNLKQFNYVTFFLDSKIEIANNRVIERAEERITNNRMNSNKAEEERNKAKKRVERNNRHSKFYKQLNSYKFIENIIYLNPSNSPKVRAETVIKTIEKLK